MGIYKDTEAIKKIMEDVSNIFKAASEEEISNRPASTGWDPSDINRLYPEEVQLLRDVGFDIDINPDDDHRVGFFDPWGDIRSADELPSLFKDVIKAAKTIEIAVEGPKPK